MASPLFRTAAVLALLSAGSAQAAQAPSCVTRAEMRGLVAYFLPTVVNSTITTCSQHLSGDTYLVSRAPTLVTTLDKGKDAAWPSARSAFLKIGGKGKDAAMIEKLPDDLLRPLIETIITTELLPGIKPGQCADIDRIARTMEPLPADNTVDLVAEVLSVAARGDSKIPSCPVG